LDYLFQGCSELAFIWYFLSADLSADLEIFPWSQRASNAAITICNLSISKNFLRFSLVSLLPKPSVPNATKELDK